MTLQTKNLLLIPCDAEILTAGTHGHENLAQKLGVIVPEHWTEFGVESLQYALDKLLQSEEEKGWWTYLPIYKAENKLIGSGGYQGKPDANGAVEIGYEISVAYHNRGLATEMTMGLVENAFQDPRVRSIIAHTLGEENPSTKVLSKCGFEKIAILNDPDEGLIWKWELQRPEA